MNRIKFHPDVQNEIQSAFDWYNTSSSGLGDEFLNELEASFELITNKPKTWAVVSSGFRRYLLKRFPFGIIYKSEKNDIYIIAVMHLSRKPGYWKTRN